MNFYYIKIKDFKNAPLFTFLAHCARLKNQCARGGQNAPLSRKITTSGHTDPKDFATKFMIFSSLRFPSRFSHPFKFQLAFFFPWPPLLFLLLPIKKRGLLLASQSSFIST